MINMEFVSVYCDGCDYSKECYDLLVPRKNFNIDNCPCCHCIIKGICSHACTEFDNFMKDIFDWG